MKCRDDVRPTCFKSNAVCGASSGRRVPVARIIAANENKTRSKMPRATYRRKQINKLLRIIYRRSETCGRNGSCKHSLFVLKNLLSTAFSKVIPKKSLYKKGSKHEPKRGTTKCIFHSFQKC